MKSDKEYLQEIRYLYKLRLINLGINNNYIDNNLTNDYKYYLNKYKRKNSNNYNKKEKMSN